MCVSRGMGEWHGMGVSRNPGHSWARRVFRVMRFSRQWRDPREVGEWHKARVRRGPRVMRGIRVSRSPRGPRTTPYMQKMGDTRTSQVSRVMGNTLSSSVQRHFCEMGMTQDHRDSRQARASRDTQRSRA